MSFRLYVKRGCPACLEATKWLEQNGLNEVVMVWEIGNDPIIHAGVKAFGDAVPILVSFIPENGKPGKVVPAVPGMPFNKKEYERLAKLFHGLSRADAFDVAVAEREPVAKPTAVADNPTKRPVAVRKTGS